VSEFRKIILVALASGALAGFVLFVIQHFTITPLIRTAETYEKHSDSAHQDEGWQPSSELERVSLTALATVLTGIGFAAIFFGLIAFTRGSLSVGRGVALGLAAFVSVDLAPALGLPPTPPGVPLPDLSERQIWWFGTVIATALGLWLVIARRGWLLRVSGLVLLALPHVIGAPRAGGHSDVPAWLVHQFAFASLTTTGVFWLVLGAIGGLLYRGAEKRESSIKNPTPRSL
jgi:cobalt transporter subunit CbtA